jgi:hypothetical protein
MVAQLIFAVDEALIPHHCRQMKDHRIRMIFQDIYAVAAARI